jgi:hypothetical protein
VIRLPRPTDASSLDRIVLSGDDEDFDNTFYATPPVAQQVNVVWFGDEMADDTASPRYYFELAVADDPVRIIDIDECKHDQAWRLDPEKPPALIVATAGLSPQMGKSLSDYLTAGGMLVVVMSGVSSLTPLESLVDDIILAEPHPAEESNGTPTRVAGTPVPATLDNRQYSLLGEIDFMHPIFAGFANPRYSDFTKIHFWRHQRITVKEPAATRVVARFDNGDPAILERSIGTGRVLILTSGWQPDESQLALSSKFVPIIQAIVDMACGTPLRSANLLVGRPVPLPARGASQSLSIEKPDGTRLAMAGDVRAFDDADQPGIYHLHLGPEDYSFSVNLAAAESNTAPMDLERLEQLGVRFASQQTRADRAAALRQQRDTELESHQQLWRWLIVVAIGLLIVESWYAGWTSRQLDTELATSRAI